jgi:hypothetical protein
MELLLSNIAPAKISSQSTQKVWKDYFEKADYVKIATGFVSSDSLIELKRIIEINHKPHLDLLIGMHFFDGFTKPQYEAAISLNNLLKEEKLGNVLLSNVTKFHGKMYSFIDHKSCFAACVGSSNLSSFISSSEQIYEADCHFNDPIDRLNVDSTITKLFQKLGTQIDTFKITKFNEHNKLLENHYNVDKVPKNELEGIWANKGSIHFEIPVKTAPKSNLNAFFGKGRVNQRKFEIPRPWYEAELIVSTKITEIENYPKFSEFSVITDDGWAFKCKTSGDYSKNFRSLFDLKILGKWIKGRLEQNGALSIGNPIDDDTLLKYGRSHIDLISTNDPNKWLLDFKV